MGCHRPFRMPLWPIPPILALAGVVIALTQQKGTDLLGAAAIFGVAAIYYFAFVRPRSDRYWNIANAQGTGAAPLAGGSGE